MKPIDLIAITAFITVIIIAIIIMIVVSISNYKKKKNPKIEFIKEVTKVGSIQYYTNINGIFTSGSLSFNKDEGYEKFLAICETKGKSTETVLEKC